MLGGGLIYEGKDANTSLQPMNRWSDGALHDQFLPLARRVLAFSKHAKN